MFLLGHMAFFFLHQAGIIVDSTVQNTIGIIKEQW